MIALQYSWFNKDVQNDLSKIILIACVEIGVLNSDAKSTAQSFLIII